MPDAPEPARRPALDGLLLYRLHRLFSVGGSLVIRLCEGQFGITRREWRLIAVLAGRPDLSSSQLAQHAYLDAARTSRAIGSLVDKALVLRTHAPGDRRQVKLRLTPAGDALYEQLFPLVEGINAQLLQALAPGEVQRFDQAIAQLQARAAQMVAASTLPKADRRRRAALSPPGVATGRRSPRPAPD